jgi:hypothetical protein
MDSFITFLKMLFMGKAILLTPVPVDINNLWLELELNKPLQAITGGASLEVRFSRKYQLFMGLKNSNEIIEVAKKAFPEDMIEAKLVAQNGNEIILSHRVLSISNDYVSYGIVDIVPLPTNVKFNELKLKSSIEINDVEIFWKNYKL